MSPPSSAPSSAPSSKPPSVKSQTDLARSPRLTPQSGEHPLNGAVEPPLRTTSVKERFSRMFTPKGGELARSSPDSTSRPVAPAPAKPNGLKPPSPPPVRKASPSEKVLPKEPPARFVLHADAVGGHDHNLKHSRRQEKLTDMWQKLLGRKQEYNDTENDLSLVSSWVDRGGVGSQENLEKRAAVQTPVSLVEKYGKCQEVVGRGAFGVVRISHKKLDNGGGEKLYAVKEFKRRPEETERKYSKRLTSEFCISSSLRHANVIHTLDLLKDAKGDYCEVMEYCAGGDLYSLVLSAGKLEAQEADCFFKQLMRGVNYLHEMGVAHRDLKPENLLLTTRGALKITDFGNGECFRMAWESDAHMVSGLCGSAPYIAPEEYVDKEFDARAVDVWACGVIYMAMRTGRHLWRVAKKEEDEFYARYLEGRRDEEGYGPIESLHRARCRNVVYSILDPNPSRRLAASQVLKSEWGREIKVCKAGDEGY